MSAPNYGPQYDRENIGRQDYHKGDFARISGLPPELPFDHAASFVESLDAALDHPGSSMIFVINGDGSSHCIKDRRVGDDRRTRTRRAEDVHDAHLARVADVETVRAHNRRMWALGAICYLTGLVTALMLLAVTS